MAELAGKTNQVWALAGAVAMSSSTGAKILSMNDSSWNEMCDALDVLAYGDTYKRRIAGMTDVEMTLSGNYDPADSTGQGVLEAGATVYLGVYPQGTTVAGTQAEFLVTGVNKSFPAAGIQEISFTVVCNSLPVALPSR